MKVFVPFSEALIAAHGLSLGDLVPFDLEYECLHVGDLEIEEVAPELEGELQP